MLMTKEFPQIFENLNLIHAEVTENQNFDEAARLTGSVDTFAFIVFFFAVFMFLSHNILTILCSYVGIHSSLKTAKDVNEVSRHRKCKFLATRQLSR